MNCISKALRHQPEGRSLSKKRSDLALSDRTSAFALNDLHHRRHKYRRRQLRDRHGEPDAVRSGEDQRKV